MVQEIKNICDGNRWMDVLGKEIVVVVVHERRELDDWGTAWVRCLELFAPGAESIPFAAPGFLVLIWLGGSCFGFLCMIAKHLH